MIAGLSDYVAIWLLVISIVGGIVGPTFAAFDRIRAITGTAIDITGGAVGD